MNKLFVLRENAVLSKNGTLIFADQADNCGFFLSFRFLTDLTPTSWS
jgi:hypothetical protein